MELQIHKALESDLSPLAAMMAESFPWTRFGYTQADCLKKLCVPGRDLYVAKVDSRPVGFVFVNPEGDFGGAHIRCLCVSSSCRGQGVGTKLMHYISDQLYPAKSIYLRVSQCNPEAEKLYLKLGFERIGEKRDYNFRGESEFIMCLDRGPKRQTFCS